MWPLVMRASVSNFDRLSGFGFGVLQPKTKLGFLLRMVFLWPKPYCPIIRRKSLVVKKQSQDFQTRFRVANHVFLFVELVSIAFHGGVPE